MLYIIRHGQTQLNSKADYLVNNSLTLTRGIDKCNYEEYQYSPAADAVA